MNLIAEAFATEIGFLSEREDHDNFYHFKTLNQMNKIIKKISQAVQMILLAPIKLPGKAMHIIKYVAVGLGILETITEKESREDGEGKPVARSGDKEGEADDAA